MSNETLERNETASPIQMVYRQAPKAGVEARSIWEAGMSSWGMDPITEGIPNISLGTESESDVDLETGIRFTFGFVEMWGREGGDSNVIACLSNYLLGFDGTNAEAQRACGLDILDRITNGIKGEIIPFGPNKYVAFLETSLDATDMRDRVLDSQTEPIGEYFPRFKTAQQEIDTLRRQELLNSPDGSNPFVDIFHGEVSTLKRAFEANGNHYFDWGWEQKGDYFEAINPDNKRQTLEDLAENATLQETGEMLTKIRKFLDGNTEKGRNRFVVQLDFGVDAVCCNVAFNAQQSSTLYSKTSEMITSSKIIQSDTIKLFPTISSWINDWYKIDKEKDMCNKHGKKKTECDCKDENDNQGNKENKKSN